MINAANGDIVSEKEIEIGTGEYGFNTFFKYCNSTNYSVIFAFRDFRADTLRIQKLDTNGNKLWGDDPLIVTPTLKGYTKFEIESDHNGGAFIFYLTQDDTFRLAHFDDNGQRMWNRTFFSESGYNSMHSFEKMTAVSID